MYSKLYNTKLYCVQSYTKWVRQWRVTGDHYFEFTSRQGLTSGEKLQDNIVKENIQNSSCVTGRKHITSSMLHNSQRVVHLFSC